MTLLDHLVAFLTAVLSGTGVGGGGLYVIYLRLVRDVPQLKAQGINLAFFIMGAMSSMLLHLRRRKLRLPLVLLVGTFGAAGALLGAYMARSLETALLSKIFGGMLILCGARTLFQKVKK